MSWIVQVFRVLSSCTSTMMILSFLPTIYRVFKNKSTGLMPASPLATLFLNCHLWLIYGYMTENYFPLFATFTLGDVLSISYMIIYYKWAVDRRTTRKYFLLSILGNLVLTIYTFVGGFGYTNQSRDGVAQVVGYIGTIASFALYSSPFEKIGLVFKYRSGVFLPIEMIVAGAVNNGTWVIYSLMTIDWFVFTSNIFSFAVGLVQIGLYVAFHPSTHPLPADYEADKTDLEAALPSAANSPVVQKDLDDAAADYRSVLSPQAPVQFPS